MVLFTILGLVAFYLRERKDDSAQSGRDEDVDQRDDVPPVESNDGQTTSQDITGDPEVLSTGEEPITGDPEVPYNEDEPITGDPEVISTGEEPVTGDPEVPYNEDEPITGDPEVISTGEEPVTGDPEVLSTGEEPITGDPEVPYKEDEPITGDPEVISTGEEPVTGDPEVPYKEDEAITGDPEVISTGEEPVTGDPEVLSTGEEPVTGDPEVLPPGEEPITGDPEVLCNGDEPITHDPVSPQSSQQLDESSILKINSYSYDVITELGEGGFGTVYAATRLEDGLQVALKFASNKTVKYVRADGYSKSIPLEVALHNLANQGPRVPEIIQLLDWQEEDDRYIMVLERSMPCQSLYDFIQSYAGTIDEDLAWVIMRQATYAALTCCRRGVFHRDIKLTNLLINPKTLKVKLIDFGCGELLTSAGYTSFAGTREYRPPEYCANGRYHGEPATVWSLGILLFVMLLGYHPMRQDLRKINDETWTKNGLSQECRDLICCCLQNDPEKRIELENLRLHNWFKNVDEQNSNGTIMDINSCFYEIGIQLGDIQYGTVYAATRLKDGLQVAMKFASSKDVKYVSSVGYAKPIPLEVALHNLANQEPRVPEIVQLLDWQDRADHYIMVLERPMPYEELSWFVLRQIANMEEDLARVIMRQTTFAAQTCCQRGVFHGDIKLENFLINPDTLKVKLINFGCSQILTSAGYTSFAGTKEYRPPEYRAGNGKYHGEPATVWSLGILLFAMVCGKFPGRQDLRKINDETWTQDGLSQECHDLICLCLQNDPEKRIELENLRLHNWFKIDDKETF